MSVIDDVRDALSAIEFPFENLSRAWQHRAAKVVLALGGASPTGSVRDVDGWPSNRVVLGSRALIEIMNRDWGESISRGSYDDIRRQCVQYLVEAGVAVKDPDDPGRSPNSPKTGYALAPEFAELLRRHGSPIWRSSLASFRRQNDSLRAQFRRERARLSVVVSVANGVELNLSPGPHNQLQAAIVEHFLPQFASGCELVYVADALARQLYINEALLKEIDLFALDHRQLPDVIALDRQRGWLLIIEAVASSGHISPLRKVVLDKLLKSARFPPVFVTAFPNYATFGRFAGDIAWETEVWIADHPTHMIHFNGDRYLGPHHS